jgi:hypothetical protein
MKDLYEIFSALEDIDSTDNSKGLELDSTVREIDKK